jgi:IS4 transposase
VVQLVHRRSIVKRLGREIDRLVNIWEMAIKKIYMRNPDREDAPVEDRFVETAERAMRALKSWDEEIERRLDLDYADERPSESGGNGSVRVGVEEGDEDRG